MNDSYGRYYEKNREALKTKMKERYIERKQYLADHPEAVAEEREKNRQRYLSKRAYRIRRQLEEWLSNPSLPELHRTTITEWIEKETYKTLKPSALRNLGTFLSLQ